MKYIEIIQRLQIQFPDVAEGMVNALFNQYSKVFQRETYYGTITSATIPAEDFVTGNYSGLDVISLEAVSENGEPFSLIYVDTPDLSSGRVKVSNQKFYFINDNTIYLCVSDSNGYLTYYSPINDILVTGRFINVEQLITEDTTTESNIDDTLALSVLYAVYSELYKILTKEIDLAEYYKKEFREAQRQYKKYGLFAKRPATMRGNW